MKQYRSSLVVTLMLTVCFSSSVFAGGLLGVDSGNAGNDSTVNVGVGSGGGSSPGNIVDVNVLGNGTGSAGNVNISSGGTGGSNGGLIDGDIDLLGGNGQVLDADVDLNGNDIVDVVIGGGGGTGIGICVDVFGDCATPAPGGAGQGPGAINVADLSNGISAECFTPDDRRALTLIAMGGYTSQTVASWARATAVNVIPVRPCPELKARIAAAISGSGLHQVVQRDALISATLTRSKHEAGDVLAVIQKGATVHVFVL